MPYHVIPYTSCHVTACTSCRVTSCTSCHVIPCSSCHAMPSMPRHMTSCASNHVTLPDSVRPLPFPLTLCNPAQLHSLHHPPFNSTTPGESQTSSEAPPSSLRPLPPVIPAILSLPPLLPSITHLLFRLLPSVPPVPPPSPPSPHRLPSSLPTRSPEALPRVRTLLSQELLAARSAPPREVKRNEPPEHAPD